MRVALGLEYDGSRFAGWEVQPGQRTVQGSLEEALGRVAAGPVKTVCAGRTDAGVHAWAQVVHIDTAAHRSERSWVLGTNANLPSDVGLRWARHVPDDFSARFSAVSRHYRYLIHNGPHRPVLLAQRVGWERRALDLTAMRAAAVHLLGEHDFSAFRAVACQAKSPVRNIHRLDVARQGPLVTVDVVANAFLHHMVRNIVGALLSVGMGRHGRDWTAELLAGRDRTLGAATAPACGLYLTGVTYPERYALPSLSAPRLVW